ncbi:MAG: T9SS type A sorting domain-containing protein [Flavobacteriales bacterium]
MKNLFGFVLLLATSLSSLTSMYGQGPDEYWIGLEEYAVHTNGDLEGMTTWRMYLHMLDEDDYLSACTGSDSHPFILESTSSPAWYQHPSASETFATGINTAFFTAFPDLEYDSWFTIGVEDSSIDMDILSLADPTYDAFAAFEAGENVYSDTPVGNGWATLYPGLGAENPGFAGEDLRLLIGQITTAGTLSGSIYVQIFPWGVQDPDLRLLLPILYTPTQCMDENACNYDASAWTNDECEYGPSAGVIEGDQDINLNAGTTEWSYSCSDEASSFEWSITGGTILSGQGTSFVTVQWTTDGEISVTAISADGCPGLSSTLEIDILMGLEGLTFSDNLTIFPSPASSNMTVSLDGIEGNKRCQIYSLTGKKVLAFVLENNTRTLDVSNLANGTYILAVNTDQGAVKQAFVIAK